MFAIHRILFILFFIVIIGNSANAQNDSIVTKPLPGKENITSPIHSKKDSTGKFSVRKAVIRSAIIPGWGQVYNKRVWKVPVIYGALGTTAALFFRNLRQYNESKAAYQLAADNDPSNDYLIKQPYYNVKNQPDRIRTFRNQVRQNVDYCVIFFLIFWGANVADAAVDAHLKSFDVSDDLSLHIKPGYSPMANTNGISLVLAIKK